MKRFLIALSIAMVCSPAVFLTAQEEKIDTILLKDGRKIPAKVTSISAKHVNFVNIDKSARERVERKDVRKIIYHNGVAQELNPAVLHPAVDVSWEDVRITGNRKDVAGLHRGGAVEAASPVKAGDARAARREAETQLKKKAAALHCRVVLVTGRELKRNKGRRGLYLIKGIAYGREPRT